MHIRAENVHKNETNQLIVEVTQGQNLIESFARSMEVDQEEVTLRFAGARFGNEAYIVVGVRKQGRGFDILFSEMHWNSFTDEIDTLSLHCIDQGNLTVSLSLDWDEEAFQAFLDQCQQRFDDDPNLEVMGKIVHFFS